MGNQLKFNPAAVKSLNGNTRVRLSIKTRGGETFFALRPSYRVSGKNVQLLVEAVDGEKFQTADMSAALSAQIAGLPELINNTHYHLEGIGYQWFILKKSDEAIDDKKPGVFVSKLREKAVKKTDEVVAPAIAPDEDQAGQGGALEGSMIATAESSGDGIGGASPVVAEDATQPADTTDQSGETADVAEQPAEAAEQAAASAKPKRVRPSRAKAKVDVPKAADAAE